MKRPVKVLALDQSISCTGWCIFEGGCFDMTSFGCIKTAKVEGDLWYRTNKICQVVGMLSKQVDVVVREGLGFGGSNSNASRDLAYLVGALEITVGRPFGETPPTSLKKFATGSGKAKKEDMIAALPEHILDQFAEAGYKKSTGLADLADAYFLGMKYMNDNK